MDTAKKNANVIPQIFNFDTVKKSRALVWKADLAMLVMASRQALTNDKDVHKHLLTEVGIEEVAQYASIYAPSFSLLAEPSADDKSYTISPRVKWAKAAGMRGQYLDAPRGQPGQGICI